MTYYERNLPHWHPQGAAIFLTWRLHGSIHTARRCPNSCSAGAAFAALDCELDRAAAGPRWLCQPAIAERVVDALRYGDEHLRLYRLASYCVMPNHVHLLIDPERSVAGITRMIKGYTARQANQLLGRCGQPFWQDETYDHWVRDRDERQRIIRYIERNPVKAGLVGRIDQWPWSSAVGLKEPA
jgi:putative transposase